MVSTDLNWWLALSMFRWISWTSGVESSRYKTFTRVPPLRFNQVCLQECLARVFHIIQDDDRHVRQVIVMAEDVGQARHTRRIARMRVYDDQIWYKRFSHL